MRNVNELVSIDGKLIRFQELVGIWACPLKTPWVGQRRLAHRLTVALHGQSGEGLCYVFESLRK
jgi:hypothetical protein